jgi:hypothetical protein
MSIKKHRTHCQRAYLYLMSQGETIISLNSIWGPVFVKANQYVYCQIRAEEFRYRLDTEELHANNGFPPLSNIPPLHHIQFYLHATYTKSVFGGLEVACWPLVPKFAGSHTAEAVGFLGWKNLQHAFLRGGGGGGIKSSVPCRSFTACKGFLNITWKSAFR